MKIRLNREIQNLLKTFAGQRDEESCGVLFEYGVDSPLFIPIPNTSLNKKHNYVIWPDVLYHIEKALELEDIHLAFVYHSHLTGDLTPSDGDISFAFNPDLVYLIGDTKKLRAWHIQDRVVEEVDITM